MTETAATIAREILAAFTKTDSGYSARVGQMQIRKWNDRLDALEIPGGFITTADYFKWTAEEIAKLKAAFEEARHRPTVRLATGPQPPPVGADNEPGDMYGQPERPGHQ